ncbi:LON peptidase substrate-binding domain-containing protein [Granulicoccus sp. GXG6511]|uniref:LON peptidase substrate-binding domain-containing protein n=1 Tax=Granulicoccus sp. GXG6511 TaxID=3381351 RepID=UPI003D7D5CCA
MTPTIRHREVPLFPLGMVQFPGMPLELRIFEPRYLRLLEDLTGTEPREFGVVAISSGHEVGQENLHGIVPTGCAVRIDEIREAGSRVLLRATGTWRFDRIEIVDRATPYLMARVRPLPDDSAVDSDAGPVGALRAALLAYADAAGLELGTVPADPDELIWWLAAGGPFTQTERLRVLAAARAERLDLLTKCLRREAALLRSTGSVPFQGDRRQSTN